MKYTVWTYNRYETSNWQLILVSDYLAAARQVQRALQHGETIAHVFGPAPRPLSPYLIAGIFNGKRYWGYAPSASAASTVSYALEQLIPGLQALVQMPQGDWQNSYNVLPTANARA